MHAPTRPAWAPPPPSLHGRATPDSSGKKHHLSATDEVTSVLRQAAAQMPVTWSPNEPTVKPKIHLADPWADDPSLAQLFAVASRRPGTRAGASVLLELGEADEAEAPDALLQLSVPADDAAGALEATGPGAGADLASDLLVELGRGLGDSSLKQLGARLRGKGRGNSRRHMLLAALAQSQRSNATGGAAGAAAGGSAACGAALQGGTKALRRAQADKLAAEAQAAAEQSSAGVLRARLQDMQTASVAADTAAEDAAERSEWFAASLRRQREELVRAANALRHLASGLDRGAVRAPLRKALVNAERDCKALEATASGPRLASALSKFSGLAAGAAQKLAGALAGAAGAGAARAPAAERAEAARRSAAAAVAAATKLLKDASSQCQSGSMAAARQAAKRRGLALALRLHAL